MLPTIDTDAVILRAPDSEKLRAQQTALPALRRPLTLLLSLISSRTP